MGMQIFDIYLKNYYIMGNNNFLSTKAGFTTFL